MDLSPNGKCASYFALVMRWLHFLTLVTYYCMLPGMRKFAAFPQHEFDNITPEDFIHGGGSGHGNPPGWLGPADTRLAKVILEAM